MNTTNANAEITIANIQGFAVATGYSGATWYRNAALAMARHVKPTVIRRMLKDGFAKVNERRRASHELHHHYHADLCELAALVEVAETIGVSV